MNRVGPVMTGDMCIGCSYLANTVRTAVFGLTVFALAAVGPVPDAQAGNPAKATADWLWEKYGKMYYPDTKRGALEWLVKHHLADVDSDDPHWTYLPYDLTRSEVDSYANQLAKTHGKLPKTTTQTDGQHD